MKTIRNKILVFLTIGLVSISFSCEDYFEINKSPNNVLTAPIQNVLTAATVNIGFSGGSDIHRYTSIWVQQNSGQGGDGVQTREYEKYLVQPTDLNNLWNSLYSGTLRDLEYVIEQGTATGNPHYTGVAKLLKAFVFHLIVDAWGDVPYSEALKLTANLAPKYDQDSDIYTALITLIDEGIAEVKAATSNISPGTNETIYGGNKTKWEKFGNTLKLRLFLHYSESDPTFATSQITNLVNSGAIFLENNGDNFQHAFINQSNAQNPIHQFEVRRTDQFFPNKFLVDLMNTNVDPRRPKYFTPFPWTTNLAAATYKGNTPGDAQSVNYSRIHEFLRGARTNASATITPNGSGGITTTAITYGGEAPIRMLTFAEYNFIRAEAALRFGAAGSAQTFYTAGITAAMDMAGVTAADRNAYLATPRGTLSGTTAQQLQQIIEEKYVANYGVAVEPYSDWRRTGYPLLTAPAVALETQLPRSLYYPQNEADQNPNVTQKPDRFVRVFWDTRP